MFVHSEAVKVKTLSLEFVRAYVTTMRPYLMFVSGITGIAGLAFCPHASTSDFILRFAASFLSYGFGQALTDCFQIDTDSLSSPYRPMTQGIISRFQTASVSVVGLTFCIGIFAEGNLINLVLGAIAGAGLATYTFFKKRWWGGPFYNAWIVVVLCSMARLTGGGTLGELLSPPTGLVLLAVLFGYANFVLSGYFKDVDADRATGYKTLVVVFGHRPSAWTSDFLAFVALAAGGVVIERAATLPSPEHVNILPCFFFVAAFGVSLVAQRQLHRVRTDSEAYRPIALVVHAYILLLSGIACDHRPDWFWPLVVFYMTFNAVLKVRPAINQI